MAVDIPQGETPESRGDIDPNEPARPRNPARWTRAQITRLQTRLKEDGYYDGPIDGIFGPASRAAWKEWEANDKTPAHANEPARGPLDEDKAPLDTDNSSGGGGGGKGGDDAGKGDGKARRGVPGGSKLWKVGDTYYLVYNTPRLDVPMAWKIPASEVKAITGSKNPTADRTLTRDQFNGRGVIVNGNTTQLVDIGKHPWDAFKEDFADELRVRPWLRDPEMLAIATEAYLEGRSVTEAELAGTQWWQSRTPGEREWAQFVAINGGAKSPAVQQRFNENRDIVLQRMVAAGFDVAGGDHEKVVDWFNRQLTTGKMSETQLDAEIEKASNPYARDAYVTAGRRLPEGSEVVRHKGRFYLRWEGKDYALAKGLEGQMAAATGFRKVDEINDAGKAARDVIAKQSGTPQGRDSVEGLERVRSLVLSWLGPVVAKGWKESEIAAWAQRLNENEADENMLMDVLRKQREAAYPDFDPNLSYDQIAVTPRALIAQVWGQELPDEESPLFQQLLVMAPKDRQAATQLLWKEGLKQGVRQVTYDSLEQLGRGIGSPVVGSAV